MKLIGVAFKGFWIYNMWRKVKAPQQHNKLGEGIMLLTK
jgi:hypothetical protein